ncbi:tetratricopeptide repeat protein [Singulisphaera sp. PoT]|uniref:tetratricopeptide repeat protein n=1 Tax=Singulisphaera sp. PoT TaxID=3411797 RepID=UPI003BF5BFC2
MTRRSTRLLWLVAALLPVGTTWAAWSWMAPGPDLREAIALAKSNRFDEAEALAQKYLARDPKSARAHMLLAQFALNRPESPSPNEADPEAGKRNARRALEHLDQIRTDATNLDPKLPPLVALYRGKARNRLGSLVEAEASWEEALRLDPQIPEAGWHLLEMQYLQGRVEDSRQFALKMHGIELDPHDRVQYLVEILRQEARTPAPESLLPIFEPIVRDHPQDYRARIALGLARVRSGRIDAGIDELRQAVRLQPERPEPWQAWLTGMEEAGQIDNLIRAWDRLPLSFADSDRFSTFAARIEQERGDFAKAIEQYRRARHASPWDRTALFRLGRALSNAGKTAEAAEVDRELRGINEAVAEVPSLHEELNALPDLGITPYPELCERVARNRQQLEHLDESRAWQALADRDRAKELASRP